VDIGARSRRR